MAYCTNADLTLLTGTTIATATQDAIIAQSDRDMNDKVIADMKNSAPTALSGTQKDIEIDIGGTAYYFTVYPTKA